MGMLEIPVLLLVLIAVAVCLILYRLWFHESRIEKLKSIVGGPRALPLFGNSLYFLGPTEDILPKIRAWCDIYGRRFITRYSGNCFFNTWSAADAEVILSSQTHIEKGSDYDYLMPWLGTGLLTSKGKKWFTRRKLLTPTFHFKILEDFISVFNEHSTTLVEILKTEFANEKVGDISGYVARCTLDVLCETAMGERINAQHDRDTDYINAVYRMGKLIQLRTICAWLQPEYLWRLSAIGKEHNQILKILHGFTESVIRKRKAMFLSKLGANIAHEDDTFQVKRRLAFLDLLLEAQQNSGGELSDLDIREETDTFMFEGHDTTYAGINFALNLIGCHPDIQSKLHRELDEIFGDDRTRPVTSQDLPRLKYLECCLKESLRLFPSVPFVERLLRSDMTLHDGTIVPAGVTCLIIIYQMHRDPISFPNPETFDPDRFLPENQILSGRNHYAYVPFSAGPRNCIGQKFAMMELKIVVANILRNFTIKSQIGNTKLRLLAELILRPMDGIQVKLIPRIS